MEDLDPTKLIVINDQRSLDRKISAIRFEFQVIADFDATLTRYWVNGLRGQSSHGLLKQGNPEYDAKRQALFEYYHPLEFSPAIPLEEKTKLMEEWWGKTHGLLIEGGLTYDAIKSSVANSNIAFRDGVVELFELLEAHNNLVSEPAVIGDEKTLTAKLEAFMEQMATRQQALEEQGSSGGTKRNSDSQHGGCMVPRYSKMEFSTYDGVEDPLGWLKRCKKNFGNQRTNEEDKVGLASFHLLGEAQLWIDQMEKEEENLDWGHFKECCHTIDLKPRQQVNLFTARLIEELRIDIEMQQPENLGVAMNMARTFERKQNEKDVPVLIFSAGLADIIEEVLRQKVHRYFKNIKIISNQMVFDDSGRLVSFKGKLIHSLNKNEHALDMATPLHDQTGGIDSAVADNASVKQRTNVLLLGDHTGDLGMSDGLNYENRISVGFLNDNIEKNLESYRKAFDIVYLNDRPMWGVVDLAAELCSKFDG
ncbi:hypothetical protein GOBAR_DD04133 [Gossypium barbadense]|nr:hypothetical protein GOBAR_DD04133 [Gossypium barbadense]